MFHCSSVGANFLKKLRIDNREKLLLRNTEALQKLYGITPLCGYMTFAVWMPPVLIVLMEAG